MKAKLIKTSNGYGLSDCELIAFYSSVRPEHNHWKLSEENCEEVFYGKTLDQIKKDYIESESKFWPEDEKDEYMGFLENDAILFLKGFKAGVEFVQSDSIEVRVSGFTNPGGGKKGELTLERI